MEAKRKNNTQTSESRHRQESWSSRSAEYTEMCMLVYDFRGRIRLEDIRITV